MWTQHKRFYHNKKDGGNQIKCYQIIMALLIMMMVKELMSIIKKTKNICKLRKMMHYAQIVNK